MVCVPQRKPGLAKPSGLSLELLGHVLAWISTPHVPKVVSFLRSLSSTGHNAVKAHREGKGEGDLIAHLSIYLRSCLDIINQQTDFPLSLISPDPKLLKFNQSGNTRPLSEISKSSNSYQHHVFCFP